MTQPLAIYASIPVSTGADWLATLPDLAPVTVTSPYPHWPSLDWSVGNLAPLSGYGEIPQYLWANQIPDPMDNEPKRFTRRLTASAAMPLPTIKTIPVGGRVGTRFRLIFSIAGDDQYTFQLKINGRPLPREAPVSGSNNVVPQSLPWRNVATYAFGVGAEPVIIRGGDELDIQTTATNAPLPEGAENLAMISWVLQLFSSSKVLRNFSW